VLLRGTTSECAVNQELARTDSSSLSYDILGLTQEKELRLSRADPLVAKSDRCDSDKQDEKFQNGNLR